MHGPIRVRRVQAALGSTVQNDLNSLPSRADSGLPLYIDAILLRVRLVLVSASTSDAIAVDEFSRVISALEFRDNKGQPFLTRTPIGGRFIRQAAALLLHKNFNNNAAAIAANSNVTNTRDIAFVIPLRLPEAMEPDMHCRAAFELKGGNIFLTWCPSNEFGTGQVITEASTYCDVFVDSTVKAKISARAGLEYSQKSPDTFDRYRHVIMGRPVALWVGRPAADFIAANDFTELEVMGNGIKINRQDIDNPALAFNAVQEQTLSLPTSGAAEALPLFVMGRGEQISDLPVETDLTMTFIAGAGAPTLTEQFIGAVISKPVDVAGFAESVEVSSEVPGKRESVLAGLRASEGMARGVDGSHITSASGGERGRVWPWLPKDVPVAALK